MSLDLGDIDPRFPPEAYSLVMRAVHAALPSSTTPGGHVTPRDIAKALHNLACTEFGAGARSRLAELRITSWDDIRMIVFLMIKSGFLNQQPGDDLADFQGSFEFPATGS